MKVRELSMSADKPLSQSKFGVNWIGFEVVWWEELDQFKTSKQVMNNFQRQRAMVEEETQHITIS